MAVKNLSYECVDIWKSKIQKETVRIYWTGNYYDNEVYDDTELSAETVDILVNKCADVFKGLQLKNVPIVLYMPNVLQLPISVLAALRIGLSVLPITATNEDVDCLRDLVKNSGADTVVTIDGFWMGTRLVKTKELLDAAITDIAIQRVIVIRHVSPDEGIPPPQVNLIGRRPCYMYKVAMNQKRDLWWSKLFQRASCFCKPEAVPSESIALLLPSRYLNIGNTLMTYESDIMHPDPSRTSQIIYAYKVAKLLIAEEDLNLLLEYKEYITFWDLKSLREIFVLGSNKLCEQTEKIFGVFCRNIETRPI
ncbi:unnamed protein product [Litomosoides sigmodontis]|uniref:acetate--CoA ligase n=1 Tax=Litomosoides sigmodontis TaxID=42156 RepID=A0A3P6T507_LITSI|nr:unnamed protein product [Litomosoides sigmodontis]